MDTIDFLNDTEKEKITHFLKDNVLKEAVRKVFLKRIFYDGVLAPGRTINPFENFALNIYQNQETGVLYSDADLGQLIKVKRFAIELLKHGFDDLEKYRTIKAIVPEREANKSGR